MGQLEKSLQLVKEFLSIRDTGQPDSRLIENGTGKMGDILFQGLLRELFQLSGDSITRIKASTACSEFFPPENPLPENPPLVICFPSGNLSVVQWRRNRDMLKRIWEKFLSDDSTPCLIYFPVSHPSFSASPVVYPKAVRQWMRTNDDKRMGSILLPGFGHACINQPALEVHPRNVGMGAHESLLIRGVMTGLFPRAIFQQVQRIKNFKRNVFLMKVKFRDSNLASRYEVVKIDSLKNIQRERQGFEILHTNRTSCAIYQIRDAVLFPGEFAGGIRSCSESSRETHSFHLYTFREWLAEKKRLPDTNGLLKDLNEKLNAIYSLQHINLSQPAYPVYMNRIMPEMMDIIIPWGLRDIELEPDNGRSLTRIIPDLTAIELQREEDSQKNGGWIFKVIEIRYDPEDRDVCAAVLEAEKGAYGEWRNNEKHGERIRFRWLNRVPGWRLNFSNKGIKEGCRIRVKADQEFAIEAAGFQFSLIKYIRKLEIVHEITGESNETVIKRDSKFTGDHMTLQKKKQAEAKIIINYPSFTMKKGSSPPLERVWNPLYLLDRFSRQPGLLLDEIVGPGHGDLNLDNILIYSSEHEDDCFNSMGKNCETGRKGCGSPEAHPEMRLIDLASFRTDYPLSFDFVKLEVEIKNHILSRGMKKWIKRFSVENTRASEIEDTFVDLVFLFEKALVSPKEDASRLWKIMSSKTQLLEEQKAIDINSMAMEDFKSAFRSILILRRLGQKRYNRNKQDSHILYQQQLFFYSLRTLTYQRLDHWARLWAFLGAVSAANNLDIT